MNVKRRGFFFPVLLVIAGVLLLLNNIGVIQGSLAELFNTYWPAILILAGLNALYRNDGWTWPLALLGLGTILLLGNLNLLPTDAAALLLKTWPILLVAIGLDIVFSGKKSGGYVVLRVLIGLALVGLILWLALSNSRGASAQRIDYQQGLEGATSSQLDFSIKTGILTLEPAEDLDKLIYVYVEIPASATFTPIYTAPVDGHSALRLETTHPSALGDAYYSRYSFAVNPRVALTLKAEVDAGEMELNLAQMKAREITTEMGVGRQSVRLPCDGATTASLSLGVGDLDVVVPAGCAVTIRLDNGLAYAAIPPGYIRNGDVITSPRADGSQGAISMTVEVAMGSFRVVEE